MINYPKWWTLYPNLCPHPRSGTAPPHWYSPFAPSLSSSSSAAHPVCTTASYAHWPYLSCRALYWSTKLCDWDPAASHRWIFLRVISSTDRWVRCRGSRCRKISSSWKEIANKRSFQEIGEFWNCPFLLCIEYSSFKVWPLRVLCRG